MARAKDWRSSRERSFLQKPWEINSKASEFIQINFEFIKIKRQQ